jgi:hypothetical protein
VGGKGKGEPEEKRENAPSPAASTTDQTHIFVLEERVEGPGGGGSVGHRDDNDEMMRKKENAPDSVRPSSDARNESVRELTHHFHRLFVELSTDDRLEVADDGRERCGTNGGSDEEMDRGGVHGVVANGFVCEIGVSCVERRRGATKKREEEEERTDCILQAPRPILHRNHLRSEHPHPEHVQRLPLNIDFSHVDHAVEPKLCANRRNGNAMLSCASLGNNADLAHATSEEDLAHATSEEDLANGIVDL